MITRNSQAILKRIHQKKIGYRPELEGLPLDTQLCRGYTRVSTIKQVEDGYSLEVQAKQIEDFCNKNHYKLIKIYTDEGISGKDYNNRQGFKDLMKDITYGEAIITPSMTRLGRNQRQITDEIEKIKSKGIKLIMLDMPGVDINNDSGDFIAKFFALLAEQERKQISARTIAGMSGLIEDGKIRTKPRYGWKVVNKELIRDEDEQDVIEYIATLIEETPNITVASIVRTLESSNIKMRKASKIYPEMVRKIIEYNNLRSIN